MTGSSGSQPTFPHHRKVHLNDGDKLQNWQVVSHIADGGTSSVYRVRYVGLRVNDFPADAALKITPIANPGAGQLLIDEYEKARAVALAPNVVQANDAFEAETHESGPCVALVHELGDESLADHLRRVGPLSGAGLRRLQDDLIEGIVSLHQAKLIHSDIKPANILKFDTVWKLADLETASSTGQLTWAPFIGATPLYATPEHLRALQLHKPLPEVHPNADLWALGIVLHEAATCRHPFPDETSRAQGTPDIDPAIPDETRRIIAKCLAPTDQRLRNGIELKRFANSGDEATQVSGGAASPVPVPAPPPSPRWPYVAAASFAALSLVLAAFLLLGNDDPDDTAIGPGDTSSGNPIAAAAALAPPSCATGGDDGDGLAIRFVNSELLGDNFRAEAAQVAVDEVNAVHDAKGRPPIDYRETTTADQPTAAEVTELLATCPDALVTNLGSAASLEIMSPVGSAGVIEVSVNATSPVLDDADTLGLNFTTAPSDAIQGRLLAREIRQADKTRAAVIYLDDAYGAALKQELERNFEGGEAKPRVIAEYSFGLQDPIDRAKIAELVNAGPDAIVIIGFDQQSADVAKILGDLAYPFSSVWLVDGNPQIADYLGDRRTLLEGSHQITVGAQASGPALQYLRDKLAVSPGQRLESYDAQSYDAVIILALAAAAANSTKASAVAAEINRVTTEGQACTTYVDCLQLLESGQNIDYDGVGGRYSFTDDGRPFEALYYLDTIGPDGQPDLQRAELRDETLCEICVANDEALRITFAPSSSDVAPEFAPALQTIAGIITSSRAENVLIEGYASPDGAQQVNCALSAARAQAVHDALVNDYGVSDARLTPVGLCATDLFIENRTVLFTEPR